MLLETWPREFRKRDLQKMVCVPADVGLDASR